MFSKSHFFKPLFFLLIFSSVAFATDYTVSSANQFNNLNLQPCDVVIWTNGTYSNQNINFDALGESGSPIVLRAETPGGVIFIGESKMNIWGEYLIVDGFYWNGGVGFNNHIEFRRGGSNSDFANNSIIRNCAFNDLQVEDPTEPDAKSRWVVLYGSNNTIENCSFLNKDTTGVCILVELSYNNGGIADHNILRNYFYNVTPKDGRMNSGDSEGIRIGSSSEQTENASVLVEGNYFQEVDGENEIISNKSFGNTFRHNTFRNCRGSLVLRHGAQAIIEGNYFMGENKAKSGGIRVSDQDHIIINNYMQDLDNTSDSFNNGITLMGGDATSGGTSNGYQTISNVLIAFNTIYNSDDPIHFNDSRGNNIPTGTIANNLIYSTNGTIVSGNIATIGGQINYDGNIFGGSNIGITNSGITNANGNFVASGEIYKPSTTGPAANAASGPYSQIMRDIEGLTRPSTGKDVGAHEIVGATGTTTNPTPITDNSVGNTVGACYLDALGLASLSDCPTTNYGTNCAPIPVTGISVSPDNGIIGIGNTLQLSATVIPDNATNTQVAWSTNDNAIVTVDTNGLVMAVEEGTATITVSSLDGSFTDTASIQVLPPLNAPDCILDENLSLIGTIASFSSQQDDDSNTNFASNVLDGDLDSRWSATPLSATQNLVVDLGDSYYVGGINLYPFQGRDYQYLIEGSSTSSSTGFITLVDRTANTTSNSVISDSFSFEVVRYIRLTVTGAATYTGPWVSILDMDIVCAGTNLSIDEQSLEERITIYPNPFKDELNLSIPTQLLSNISGLRLLDITGKVILETDESSIKLREPISGGLYFLQIVAKGGNILLSKKVFKD